jgi:hypothetical protein
VCLAGGNLSLLDVVDEAEDGAFGEPGEERDGEECAGARNLMAASASLA